MRALRMVNNVQVFPLAVERHIPQWWKKNGSTSSVAVRETSAIRVFIGRQKFELLWYLRMLQVNV